MKLCEWEKRIVLDALDEFADDLKLMIYAEKKKGRDPKGWKQTLLDIEKLKDDIEEAEEVEI